MEQPMKKLLLTILMFAILLIMSCEQPEDDNPLVGIWQRTEEGFSHVQFVFTETIATGYIFGRGYNNDILWQGAYSYNDTHITITLDQETTHSGMLISWPNGLVYEYAFEGDLLLLSNPATDRFKKIPALLP
jgi:hypothetical protein